MALGWDWSFMVEENEASENQALVAEEVVPTEFALMAMSSSSSDNEKERDGIDSKLQKFVNSSKDLDQMLESQKSSKDKKGVGFDEYRVVPPPHAQVYSSPMPDLSWTGLPEFADNTVHAYTMYTPSVDVQNDILIPAAKKSMNVAQPKMKSFVKSAHSNVKRPFERKAVAKNKIWVPTVRTKNPTAGLKVPTAKPTVAAAKGNKNSWLIPHLVADSRQTTGYIDDKGFWDSGFSRHITGNISYLSDYEPYDGEMVSSIYGVKRYSGKGTIKTSKLEFENVHFMKELKYNLFSVSQICDNKNCVLFTDSECIVLGRDFKLEDDRHVGCYKTP
ncbi:hypothetical protein Tco_1172917 [Tanacetum coccineum]